MKATYTHWKKKVARREQTQLSKLMEFLKVFLFLQKSQNILAERLPFMEALCQNTAVPLVQ